MLLTLLAKAPPHTTGKFYCGAKIGGSSFKRDIDMKLDLNKELLNVINVKDNVINIFATQLPCKISFPSALIQVAGGFFLPTPYVNYYFEGGIGFLGKNLTIGLQCLFEFHNIFFIGAGLEYQKNNFSGGAVNAENKVSDSLAELKERYISQPNLVFLAMQQSRPIDYSYSKFYPYLSLGAHWKLTKWVLRAELQFLFGRREKINLQDMNLVGYDKEKNKQTISPISIKELSLGMHTQTRFLLSAYRFF